VITLQSTFLQLLSQLVNALATPTSFEPGIQHRSHVISMVVRIAFPSMVCGRQTRHLVAIDSIEVVKFLDHVCNRSGALLTSPVEYQLLEYAKRPKTHLFSKSCKGRELEVCHAHILEVVLAEACGLELRAGSRVEELVENGKRKGGAGPADEASDLQFGETSNGTEIRRAAIMFCQAAAHAFLDVDRAQNEQCAATWASSCCWQHLRKVICSHHSNASLYVLQR
jgi:hypothetical protein